MKKSKIFNIFREIKGCSNWFVLPDSATILKNQAWRIRRQNIHLLDEVELVLDVGSGNRPISRFKKLIRMDFDPAYTVDVCADAHYMPFASNKFDLVWMGGVLEHIRDPKTVIKNIYRILKDEKYIYIEIPFFQRMHGAPNDFQRFTIAGLEELCSQFTRIKSGIICGPSSAFSHILRTYLALCLSFNNKNLYHFFYYYILGWFTFPIKYLDIILSKYKNADIISFAFYYLGKKA